MVTGSLLGSTIDGTLSLDRIGFAQWYATFGARRSLADDTALPASASRRNDIGMRVGELSVGYCGQTTQHSF